MSILEPPVRTETLADVLHRLGDVSPSRIRMHPAPGTATVQDVVEIEAHENRLFELIEGVLVEKTVGLHESLIAMALGSMLHNWVAPRKLGIVSGTDGMMQIFTGLVRMPDAAFISRERLPGGHIPAEAAPLLVPDLAVEVLSKSNTRREMDRKRVEYFDAGVRLVWEVDPIARTVAVYRSVDQFRILSGDASLDGEDVLPGFMVPLKELFSVLDF